MLFDQNMILDATRGSAARFVNHSCDPNAKMEKWYVAGRPRMALFAGDRGIVAGEELTYDYNFDPFSTKNVQICHCGAPSCRGFIGRRPTTVEKKDVSIQTPVKKTKGKGAVKKRRIVKVVSTKVQTTKGSGKKTTLKVTKKTTTTKVTKLSRSGRMVKTTVKAKALTAKQARAAKMKTAVKIAAYAAKERKEERKHAADARKRRAGRRGITRPGTRRV